MSTNTTRQGYSLLVVDDAEANRDILSRRLTRRGYTVRLADGGLKALATIRDEPVDLVLLDVMMPGIDGFQVLKRVREMYSQSELPVIMATARDGAQDVIEAFDLGANDYVVKPLDFPVLLARIEAQLRTKAEAPPPEPGLGELGPGVLVDAKYRLGEAIGSGAYGTVYRAKHEDLEVEVAVKVLRHGIGTDEEALRRFRREGISACRIQHPNAVQVKDFGVTKSSVAYLVMELLQGASLAQELRDLGTLSPRRCLRILHPICDVLARAHEAGVIHRDVKPENIFLHRALGGEVVKVLDFGIAKLADGSTTQNLTAEGSILGTPAYMAPERVLGRPCDGSCDVYSLGVLLFFMLTGRLPFVADPGNPMSLLARQVKDVPPPLRSLRPELSPALDELVATTLAKVPARRPDAATLARRLARIVGVDAETSLRACSAREGNLYGTKARSETEVLLARPERT